MWYSTAACNFWDFFFFIFLTNHFLILHKKTQCTGATVSVDNVLLFENLPCSNIYSLCSTCESMFYDTFYAFQSLKVQEIQWSGCFVSNAEKHEGEFLTKDCINTWWLISTHLANSANNLITPTKDPKAPFHKSTETVDSEHQMWDVKLTTKNLNA